MQIPRNLFPFRDNSQTQQYNNLFHIAGKKGLNAKLYSVIVLLINLHDIKVSTLKPSAKIIFKNSPIHYNCKLS